MLNNPDSSRVFPADPWQSGIWLSPGKLLPTSTGGRQCFRDTETPEKKNKIKKKEEDQLFIWDGNKAGERMGVFSFALRLENSRKRLLEEKAHGHQYDLCRLRCLEVSLETGFCGG